MSGLTREKIIVALNLLADRLPKDSPDTELLLVGGAAMVLGFDARPSTRDVDAIAISGASAVVLRDLSAALAAELDLPEDWLNDGAKGYLQNITQGPVVLQRGRLTVRIAATEQLLAMKLSAWRDDLDIRDARLLLAKLAGSREKIWNDVAAHLLPGRELKAQLAFADLWEDRHAT